MDALDTYVPISHLKADQDYRQSFMFVEYKELKTRNKRPYIRAKLQDVTGQIDGVFWNIDRQVMRSVLGENKNNFALATITTQKKGEVMEFRGDGLDIAPMPQDPLNISDYIPGLTKEVVSVYEDSIKSYVNKIEDPEYRDIVGNAISKIALLDQMKRAPYGTKGELAHPGGLLVYTAKLLMVATSLAKNSLEFDFTVNNSLIICGSLLKNVGWITTTTQAGGLIRPRNAFYLTGIEKASHRFVDHLILDTENNLQIKIPEGKKQALENVINHYENIRTVEGKIIAIAEDAVALMTKAGSLFNKKANDLNWRPDQNGFFAGHNL